MRMEAGSTTISARWPRSEAKSSPSPPSAEVVPSECPLGVGEVQAPGAAARDQELVQLGRVAQVVEADAPAGIGQGKRLDGTGRGEKDRENQERRSHCFLRALGNPGEHDPARFNFHFKPAILISRSP